MKMGDRKRFERRCRDLLGEVDGMEGYRRYRMDKSVAAKKLSDYDQDNPRWPVTDDDAGAIRELA